MSLMQQVARERAQGFGFLDPAMGDNYPTDVFTSPGSSPPWWVTGSPVIGVIGKTLSNIFGNPGAVAAGAQQYIPTYQQQQQYGQPPAGYQYNSSGQLVKQAASNVTDFISNNPLLVGGGILAVVLLFLKPPGRR